MIRKSGYLRISFSILVILLSGSVVFAEDPPAGAQEASERERPAWREHGQDTRKLLEEVLMARLTKELALNEEQTVLLVRHLAEHREKMAALRRERAQLVRSLKQAVRESKDEARIEELLGQVMAQEERMGLVRKEILEVEGLELTTWQRARLLLFVHDFEGDMRRLLHRARERQLSATGRHDQREGKSAETHASPPEGPREDGGEAPAESP